jgi:hypothetical protein
LPRTWNTKAIERRVIGRMHRDELPLEMGREFGDLQTFLRQDALHLIAIGLRLRRLLQIEQPLVPGRDLHALEAEAGGPFGDRRQRVERRRVAGELSQENRRTFDGFHGAAPFSNAGTVIGMITLSLPAGSARHRRRWWCR